MTEQFDRHSIRSWTTDGKIRSGICDCGWRFSGTEEEAGAAATEHCSFRYLRNEILEEAARVIDEGQETHSTTAHGDSHHLTPRRLGNIAGLAYAAAIRALKK